MKYIKQECFILNNYINDAHQSKNEEQMEMNNHNVTVAQNILSLYQLSVMTRKRSVQCHTLGEFLTYKHNIYIVQIKRT